MSILNYFLRKKGSLPTPNSALSRSIPSKTTVVANREVELVLPQSSQKRKRKFKGNNVYDGTLRAEMGKMTCQIGPTETASKFSAKLGTPINESTMRGMKKAYTDERQKKRRREDDDLTVTTFLLKKRGRPILLGKTLDTAVQDYILKLR